MRGFFFQILSQSYPEPISSARGIQKKGPTTPEAAGPIRYSLTRTYTDQAAWKLKRKGLIPRCRPFPGSTRPLNRVKDKQALGTRLRLLRAILTILDRTHDDRFIRHYMKAHVHRTSQRYGTIGED